MLSKDDIKVLRGMFRENNEVLRKDFGREIRDEVHALIAASEHRVTAKIEAKIEKEITSVRGEIHELRMEVVELIDTSILPQIADLQQDMIVVKHKLKLA